MLSQIVRPMLRTQIQLLANSQATRSTLITTIAQWLSFIGVNARVNYLDTVSDQIQVSITVGKPDACDDNDWGQILKNLRTSEANRESTYPSPAYMNQQQRSKLFRLLAYVIQVGHPQQIPNWDELKPQMEDLGFDLETISGIRSALKVPQSLEHLTKNIDPDVAAIALSRAVSLALLDRQVNASEDQALSRLLDAIRQTNHKPA